MEISPRKTAEIIRDKLDFEAGAREHERAELYLPLTTAWDAIAYCHYPIRSSASDLANYLLSDYSGVRLRTGEHREKAIVLAEPQVRMLDAFAEVAGIGYQGTRSNGPGSFCR